MVFGFNRQVGDTAHYNLVPFATINMFLQLYATHRMAAATNLIGNVAIFVPFGVLIPLVFGGKWGRMLLIFVTCIVALEVAQLLLRRGSLDVDDLMLNVVGALMGFGALRLVLWAQHKFSKKSIPAQL
jgi:glycopeptide antibiotics resistance protein